MAAESVKFAKTSNGFAVQRCFAKYQTKLACALDDLPAKGKNKEVALRVAAVALSPILYPTLATVYAISRVFYNPDRKLRKKIDWLKKNKPQDWQKQSIDLIRQARHDLPAQELLRLKAVGVLNRERESKLQKAINKVYIKNQPNNSKRLMSMMLLGQALEIKDIYGSTHDVFIHAQAGKWTIFSHLIKEFIRRFEPETDIKHFKYLRAPCSTVDLGFFSSFWNYFFGQSPKPKTVQDYINSKWSINDDDNQVREELISVDGYFFNYQAYESSLFFLINNDNIFNNADAIKNFSKKVIKHFCPSLKNESILNQLVERIVKAAFTKAECGNLFVVCLPRTQSRHIQYRAHPFGKVCHCHHVGNSKQLTDAAILAKLQKDEVLDHTNKCHSLVHTIPQYRLYSPLLKPGKGKAIYLLTPHNKSQRKAIKEPVRKVVEEVFAKATQTT